MEFEKCKGCKCYDCATAKDSGGSCDHCEKCIKGESKITECSNDPGYTKINQD